jgi:hypothetical protein
MKLFKDPTLWPRIRQASGTVYGDIGTSVLYTTMEMTRETILLKQRWQFRCLAPALGAAGLSIASIRRWRFRCLAPALPGTSFGGRKAEYC